METIPIDDHLLDEVFATHREQDGDPAIYHDVTITCAEVVERHFANRKLPGGSNRYLNSFEDWFYEHCMKREVRPVEALEEFQTSKTASIRAIATKAMKDRYGVLQSDQLSARLVILTGKTVELNQSVANSTKWIMMATCLSTLLSASALVVSCSPEKQTSDSKVHSTNAAQ